jgi:hypothetical protein
LIRRSIAATNSVQTEHGGRWAAKPLGNQQVGGHAIALGGRVGDLPPHDLGELLGLENVNVEWDFSAALRQRTHRPLHVGQDMTAALLPRLRVFHRV